MKKFKSIFITCSMVAAVLPTTTIAQTPEEDSVSNEIAPEMVNMAFGQVEAQDILGGVSYINVRDYNYKYERDYSLEGITAMTSGFNGNAIRGCQSVLILVDGVPRNANNVLPSEIEQITVLKGPEASILYGSAGADGAIVITTRRGKVDGLEITANVKTGFNVMKNSLPQYLNSAEYMDTYNKVRIAEGNDPLYSEEDIYYHSTGENPYRYTDIDYYSSDYIKKYYNYTEGTIEMDGGNEKAHFYGNVGYYRNGSYLNFGEDKNAGNSRLNIRGNVDVDITKSITAFINANTTFYDVKGSNSNYWSAAATNRPNYPENAAPLIPISYIDEENDNALKIINSSNNIIDGKYFLGATQSTKTNTIANIYAAGHQKYTDRHFNFDAGVNANLKSLLDGLYFKATFSVDYSTSYTAYFTETYASYVPTWGNMNGEDKIISVEVMNKDKKSGKQNITGSSSDRTIGANALFGYKKSFGLHNVNALLTGNAYQETISGQYHRETNVALSFLGSYNYDRKYYIDLGLAMPHSTKLPEDNRNGLSKSVSLGWNIANEDFLKGNSIISSLSIYGSASDIEEAKHISDYYMYEGSWDTGWGYGWADGNDGQYTYCTAGANYSLDYIRKKTLSGTLKIGFLEDMIKLEGSYFTSTWEGLITKVSTKYPNFLNNGWPSVSFVPYENYNDQKRWGYEIGLEFNKQINEDWSVGLGAYSTWYDTEYTKLDEIHDYDYQYREGTSINSAWGYKCAGIFQSQEEIDNYTNAEGKNVVQKLGATPVPGDLKYIDQNNDGVIDSQDQVYLGRIDDPFRLGVNLTLKYKNFTLFAIGYGYFGGIYFKSNSYYWMDGVDAKYSVIARDCWTADNPNAKYPRLTTGSSANNYQISDFWQFDWNEFNLSVVQLSYEFPKEMFANSFIKGISVYGQGANLFKFSKEREYMETYIGSAPASRFFMVGAKLTF
ncbi:MAG: SusC/RagA family TonB-linked outer membrane protein [Bacteroidales bacterium]|nr:SusC/RagA family TonB-linked outer membrane protein [Bacteroidales bacterium]